MINLRNKRPIPSIDQASEDGFGTDNLSTGPYGHMEPFDASMSCSFGLLSPSPIGSC